MDRGQPVSLYTVRREMGHRSDAMLNQVYGHLGQVRHRAEVVEFRLEQHGPALADRLATLPASTAALFPEIVPRVVS